MTFFEALPLPGFSQKRSGRRIKKKTGVGRGGVFSLYPSEREPNNGSEKEHKT